MEQSHRIGAWHATLLRARDELHRQAWAAKVGKISGPVGDHRFPLSVELELAVLERLGLFQVGGNTQVVPRDHHVGVLFGLAKITNACAKVAQDLRLLTMTGETQVPFEDGQVGSSSMPHKRNPVDCEKIAGLARLNRGYLLAAMESTELWLERDISHSSVERVALPDAFQVTAHALSTLRRVIQRTDLYGINYGSLRYAPPLTDTYQATVDGILSGMSRAEARGKAVE